MATFFDLPLELRQEVYRLACMPESAIYSLSDSDMFELPSGAMPSAPSKITNDWKVIKRKYPTAMHLCRESRNYVLRMQHHENTRAARLGVQALDYQIGQENRAFDPQIDVLFADSWRLFYALDRHVINTFPFPKPFLDVSHIALDAQALRHEGHWLRFHHIFRRFPKLQNLSIVCPHAQVSAARSPSVPLARLERYDVRKNSEEDRICERIRAELRDPRLVDPETKYSSELWNPAAQLVGIVSGVGKGIKCSAVRLAGSRCCREDVGSRETDSTWDYTNVSMLFELIMYNEDWWCEELWGRYGRIGGSEHMKRSGLFPYPCHLGGAHTAVLFCSFVLLLLLVGVTLKTDIINHRISAGFVL